MELRGRLLGLLTGALGLSVCDPQHYKQQKKRPASAPVPWLIHPPFTLSPELHTHRTYSPDLTLGYRLFGNTWLLASAS